MKGRESRSKSSGSTSNGNTTYSFKLAPQAVRDFDEVMNWLTAEASSEVAERWAFALHEKIQSLSTFPERCQVARESDAFDEEVRQLLFGHGRGQYRVLFSILERCIYVHTIRRSSRDSVGS